jgi:hypothetical protein
MPGARVLPEMPKMVPPVMYVNPTRRIVDVTDLSKPLDWPLAHTAEEDEPYIWQTAGKIPERPDTPPLFQFFR